MDSQEQMAFFYTIFDASLPRLGPGDDNATLKALQILFGERPQGRTPSRNTELNILDLGCGNGAQTLVLARNTEGIITAVDNHQPYLDELHRRAHGLGVADKIRISHMDMAAVGENQEIYDLIWSEGALYAMGFKEGLAHCRALLAPDGLMAVTELCWLRSNPPAACRDFFAVEYPAITDIDTNLGYLRNTHYTVRRHFILPPSAWWENYYRPLEDRIGQLRKIYGADPVRKAVLDGVQAEIEIFKQYSEFYGYVFYAMTGC